MTDLLLHELRDFAERELGPPAAAGLEAALRRNPGAALRDLVAALPEARARGVDRILCQFGRQLLPRFAALYPALFSGVCSARALLLDVAPRVAAELQPYQPAAEFPLLRTRSLDRDRVEIEYRSTRGLAGLAEGLLLGCLDYYGTTAELRRLDANGAAGNGCRFLIRWTQDVRRMKAPRRRPDGALSGARD